MKRTPPKKPQRNPPTKRPTNERASSGDRPSHRGQARRRKAASGTVSRPAASTAESALLVLVEDMRAQNAATIEVVQSCRQDFRREMGELRQELTGRMDVISEVVRQNSATLVEHGRVLVELRGEVGELRGEVGELRGEVRALGSRVDDVQKDVAQLKTEFQADRAERKALDSRVTTLEQQALSRR